MAKVICNTRTQTMDEFNHVIIIFDIGSSSELKRALQTEDIQSTRHLFQMKDSALTNIEFKK